MRGLAYDVLRQLRETESHGDEIVRKAEEWARRILRDARRDAEALIDSAIAQAITEGKSVVETEEARAQAEAAESLERSREQCDELRDAARANIPRAADLVVERIVTQSGNR